MAPALSALAGPLLAPLAAGIGQLIDDVFETEEEKATARAKLLELQQAGRFRELEIQQAAILAEARSEDPWTSRARPSFLYVMYTVILLCFGAGIAGIWWPGEVWQAAENIQRLLGAIPTEMWWLFGTGYLGYTGAREFGKRAKLKALQGTPVTGLPWLER